MKSFLVLSAVMCVSAIASPIGTCVPGALGSYIGNPCAPGDNLFDNFAYSGNTDASRINTHFQMAGPEFRPILPVTGAGFFAIPSFAGETAEQAGAAPNTEGTFSQFVVANSPGTETGRPAFFSSTNSISTNSITTTSTLTAPDGSGAASPGLSSLELGVDTVVPEPASSVLIGTSLLCLGLLRKRAA